MRKALAIGLGLTAMAAILTATAAHAGEITRRERRQHARIRHGVQSGELTTGEAKHLRGEQRHIEATRERALADGHIGPGERRVLTAEQNKASADIDRLKHNERETTGAQ